jgi:uncharacterized membrane protein (DUF485 family)
MRHLTKAIKKWHRRAIFIDLHKTTVTIFQNREETSGKGNVPERVPMKTPKFLSKVEDHRKPSFRGFLSMIEIILAISSIIWFVVYVYFTGLSFQMDSMAVKSQLEVLATLSFIVGIVILVSLTTSVAVKRLFSKEM